MVFRMMQCAKSPLQGRGDISIRVTFIIPKKKKMCSNSN